MTRRTETIYWAIILAILGWNGWLWWLVLSKWAPIIIRKLT